MGLFDRFKTKGKQGFGKLYSNLFLQRAGGIQTYPNDANTYVEKGYQDNPIVSAITTITAKHGSKAPWVIRSKRTGEVVRNTLLEALMERTNTDAVWSDFMQDLITQYVLTGNGFAAMEKGTGVNEGKPHAIFMIPSGETQIIIGDNHRSIAGYRVDFLSQEADIPASDVLHIKTPNPDYDKAGNFLYGQSPFRAARTSIHTYNDSVEAGLYILKNVGADKMLVNMTEDELGPEGADKLKQKLRNTGQGVKNRGNIVYSDSQLAVLDLSIDARNALLLEQRHQAAREICNVLNFPIQLVGVDAATYQNAKEAKKALWENVLIPILCEVRSGLNRWLTPFFGDNIYLDFDLSNIDALQEDKLMRGKAIREFAGLVTINEARKMAGLKPMTEGGEEIFVNFTQSVDKGTDDAT